MAATTHPPATETRRPGVTEGHVEVFAAPTWLRQLGRTSWLLVGFLLLLGGLIWLLGATFTIVGPVLAATIVAVVAMPVADALARHMPRAAAAALVLLAFVVIAVVVLVLVLAGIADQRDEISRLASQGVDRVQGWLQDLGVDREGAQNAGDSARTAAPEILSTLLHGLVGGLRGLVSLVFGISFAALGLFFMLKDGHVMRAFVDRHVGLPLPVARTITDGLGASLRGYFRGVTLVAAFNGVVVFLGALLLGVPLAGTIGVVTFVTAYVPYVGAFVAGVFTVLIALGAKGTTTALLMLLIFLLANGLLQNLVQPVAMGSALELNPLVVLVVTIAAGCLFGSIGLVLAAPLVSAAVHIAPALRRLEVPDDEVPAPGP